MFLLFEFRYNQFLVIYFVLYSWAAIPTWGEERRWSLQQHNLWVQCWPCGAFTLYFLKSHLHLSGQVFWRPLIVGEKSLLEELGTRHLPSWWSVKLGELRGHCGYLICSFLSTRCNPSHWQDQQNHCQALILQVILTQNWFVLNFELMGIYIHPVVAGMYALHLFYVLNLFLKYRTLSFFLSN